MREMLMGRCSRGAANSIRLCSEQPNAFHLESVLQNKNMFTMLGARLTRRTPNKPLFGIRSGSSQSLMSHSCSHTDVDIL